MSLKTMDPKDCEAAFSGVLGALHNQCLYSNALYALGGVFGVAALPGWWKLVGGYLFVVAVVSFVHHTHERATLGATFWGHLDTGLASTIVIVGAAMLVGLMARPDTRSAVGLYFCLAVFLLAVYSLAIFYLSRKAATKAGGSGDATTGWGAGPLLAQRTAEGALPPVSLACKEQRYQVDYLSLHSAWHGLSAAGILLMLVALRRALVPSPGCYVPSYDGA